MSQWVADNELSVSKYADGLEHVDSGRKISSDPKTWRCEDSGKTENLWLNLSTGKSTDKPVWNPDVATKRMTSVVLYASSTAYMYGHAARVWVQLFSFIQLLSVCMITLV